MSGTDQGKPTGKSGRRNRKGERGKKKVSQQAPAESPTPVQLQSPGQDQPLQPQPDHVESLEVDQPPTVDAQTDAVVASAEPPPAAPAQVEPVPAEPPQAETPQVEPVHAEPAQAEPAPVSMQTIANAYRDYTRKSFEAFGSYVEQLSGVRSLDKAMTVQT